jgi:hypothetical protein
MNIVETFSHNYQGEKINIEIEKITKLKFVGHCKITLAKTKIEYNQAGNSTEDVKRIYEQNEILKDAALLFLNKEEADKNWDIHMSYEEAKDLTKEILIKSGYNKEFLEKVFKENKEEKNV